MHLLALVSLFVTTVPAVLPESSLAYAIFGAVSINPLWATVIIYVLAYVWFFIGGRRISDHFDEEFGALNDLDQAS